LFLQAAASESSSDSDSDADDDDYETICLDCQAVTQLSFGHVVSDVSRSTSAPVGTTAERTSGLADKPEMQTTSNMAKFGSNSLEQNKDHVITVWGSYNPEQEEPEPEVHPETDHVTQLMLPCVEEVILVISVPVLLR